ncbi:hypothetical protein ACFL59_04165 [Planctomycetota bacterium]
MSNIDGEILRVGRPLDDGQGYTERELAGRDGLSYLHFGGYKSDDPSKPIDHAASAVENLKEVGRDLFATVFPDALLKTSLCSDNSAADWVAAIGSDAADLVLGPVAAVKDAADAAIHGVMAGFKKLFG